MLPNIIQHEMRVIHRDEYPHYLNHTTLDTLSGGAIEDCPGERREDGPLSLVRNGHARSQKGAGGTPLPSGYLCFMKF